MILPQPTSDEAKRLEILRQYAILDAPPEGALDELVTLAAQICETPMAMISLVSQDRQRIIAKFGAKLGETSLDASFCGHTIQQREVFVVPDAALDERFRDNPLVIGEDCVRFYAGAPLITPEDTIIGALCVADHVPGVPTASQCETLQMLARQIMTHLELHRHTAVRKQREMAAVRLASIVEFSDDAIISKDTDGIVTSWNRGAERIFGYSASEMIGHSIMDIIPPDRAGEEPRILAKIRAGESLEHFETVRRRKDGRLIDVSVTASPIKNSHGMVIGASKIARDITGQKLAVALVFTDMAMPLMNLKRYSK